MISPSLTNTCHEHDPVQLTPWVERTTLSCAPAPIRALPRTILRHQLAPPLRIDRTTAQEPVGLEQRTLPLSHEQPLALPTGSQERPSSRSIHGAASGDLRVHRPGSDAARSSPAQAHPANRGLWGSATGPPQQHRTAKPLFQAETVRIAGPRCRSHGPPLPGAAAGPPQRGARPSARRPGPR